MGHANPVARLTPDEYLVWEQGQPNKNEYFLGEAYAMVGTTDAHNVIAGNVFVALRNHLRSSGCRAFISDVKVRPQNTDAYFYPDVFVTCDKRDDLNRNEKSHPILVVEVLSESTGDFDRGEKFAAYRRIDVLLEYVLIDPERRSIDLFRRGLDGHWVLWDARGEAELQLESVGLTLPITEVFENMPSA